MPAICLPDEPSFEQLRNQARDLRRAVLAGHPEALAEVAERFPDAAPDPFPLHTAQLVVARRYGFPSWARHFGQDPLVELLEPLTAHDPDRSAGS